MAEGDKMGTISNVDGTNTNETYGFRITNLFPRNSIIYKPWPTQYNETLGHSVSGRTTTDVRIMSKWLKVSKGRRECVHGRYNCDGQIERIAAPTTLESTPVVYVE